MSVFCCLVILSLFSLTVFADDLTDEPETLEMSESVLVQDEQTEPDEPARSEPEKVPGNVQVDEIDGESHEDIPDDESEYLELAPLEYESGAEATLADINWTLNSILFCIILCMSCAVVFLVCKIVYPLFRGGR